jgi:hypothetical protein
MKLDTTIFPHILKEDQIYTKAGSNTTIATFHTLYWLVY